MESALIFETKYGDGWRGRFDRMILVTAPEELKVTRYVRRVMTADGDAEALAADARLRLGRMIRDEVKAKECDFVIWNGGTLEALRGQVEGVWGELLSEAKAKAP